MQVASVPVQPPAQPTKVEPSAAAAVRVTAVPGSKLALHVCPQFMPDGLLLTTKDPDTQETNRFTMKLTGEVTAEIKMSAMKMPPGMPKIKPWKLTKAGASPAVASH